jgi:hypothetical protein
VPPQCASAGTDGPLAYSGMALDSTGLVHARKLAPAWRCAFSKRTDRSFVCLGHTPSGAAASGDEALPTAWALAEAVLNGGWLAPAVDGSSASTTNGGAEGTAVPSAERTTDHALDVARRLSVLPAPQVSAAAPTDLTGHGHARGAAAGGEGARDDPGWAALPAFEALCVCLYVLRPAALGSFVAQVGTRLTRLLRCSAGQLWCGGVGALGTEDTSGGAGEVSSHHTPPHNPISCSGPLAMCPPVCSLLRRAAPRNSCVYSGKSRRRSIDISFVALVPPLTLHTTHSMMNVRSVHFLTGKPPPTGESAGGEAHRGGARASRATAGGGAPGRGGHGGALAANICAGEALVRACVVGLLVPTLPAQPGFS